MTHSGIAAIFVAIACFVMAGCAGVPAPDRERMIGVPFASAHSDITFLLTTGSRQDAACAKATPCPHRQHTDASATAAFAAQAQRIAGVLQDGVRDLYPDPGLREFDVYVAAGDGPGSASSAGGKIALNAALGANRPTDDWLAFVIAREMGHVIARHHEENSAASIATSVVMNILLPGSGLLKGAASMVGSQFAASSKRGQQALEADAIAVRVLDAAGFALRDVALSLVIAPAMHDAGSWSQGFRRSSDKFVAEVRGARFAGPAARAASPVTVALVSGMPGLPGK